jgi:hypothetical protein
LSTRTGSPLSSGISTSTAARAGPSAEASSST